MQLVSVVVFAAVLVGVAVAAPPNKYSDKYDNIDVDKILKNERVLTQYINCLLDKGPCTPEGREFRKNLPDALTTSCSKCTEGQKKMIRKATTHIMKNRKGDWEQISKKFDPTGEHKESFRKFIAAGAA